MEADTDFLFPELEDLEEKQAAKNPPRDYQSPEDFQKQKDSWKPQCDTGEVEVSHFHRGSLQLAKGLTRVVYVDLDDLEVSAV